MAAFNTQYDYFELSTKLFGNTSSCLTLTASLATVNKNYKERQYQNSIRDPVTKK